LVILFKKCPRCGGDVDTTYQEDIYCVQCAHRLPVAELEPSLYIQSVNGVRPVESSNANRAIDGRLYPRVVGVTLGQRCPKCGSSEAVRLDKLRSRDNTCYRCRSCGHIFSPVENRKRKKPEATMI